MLTQCPSCQTTFRVTSEILRVAHGQVRCGRCQTQFDALERLIEENDAGDVESGRYMRPPRALPQPPETPGQIEVEEPVEHEEITLEGRHIEISGVYETIDESGQGQPQIREQTVEEWVEIDQDDALLDSEPEIEVIDMREEYSSVVEEDADIQAAAAEMEAERAASQSGQWAQQQPQATFTPTRTREPSVRSRRNPRAITVDDSPTEFDFPTQQRSDTPSPLWSLLAVPLFLALLVQVVHHYRSDLARHPQLGGPMQSIYGALGLSLRPDWNLHAYEVRQWGVIADPAAPGTLKVRASVKNLADFPQPYPLLKLVLEDRWGDQVRAREFEPAEYLDPTAAPDRMLAPAQQTNASIAIVDPGPDAEGFRFDVCLRGARGAVCAADVPGKL
ncbi:DUF3426 domain-containing protein [Steroidobacter sp.]|uniref:DUF3426 domain-containing protein n=1 Tax=Steroidobacter sp. TaxID=1978227 RepID=UPI001A62EC97|nr:DUF3426 domain-containing protein [Steroidobacter sp.]MBL8268678.1 DUF3426 domain-containing protein [Steroidobacter sp.]